MKRGKTKGVALNRKAINASVMGCPWKPLMTAGVGGGREQEQEEDGERVEFDDPFPRLMEHNVQS